MRLLLIALPLLLVLAACGSDPSSQRDLDGAASSPVGQSPELQPTSLLTEPTPISESNSGSGPSLEPTIEVPVDATPRFTSDEEAAAFDYSSATGLDMEEALRRVRLLNKLDPTLDSIRREAANIIAGLFIEHDPDLVVNLRLTEAAGPVLTSVIENSPVPIIVNIEAVLTRDQILARLDSVRARLVDEVPGLQGSGLDERTGEVILYVFVEGSAEEVAGLKAEVEEVAELFGREIGAPFRIDYLSAPIENLPR